MNFNKFNLPPDVVLGDLEEEPPMPNAEEIAEHEAELSDLAREKYLDSILFPPDRATHAQ